MISRVAITSPARYRLPEALKTPQKFPSPTPFGGEWAIVAPPERPPYLTQALQLLVLALGMGFGVYVLRILALAGEQVSGQGLLMGGLIVAASLGYAVYIVLGWRRDQRSRRFSSPLLFLNQGHYAPGDPLHITFQRDLKPGLPAAPEASLSACLRCIEVTRNSSGSSTTYHHVVHAEKDLGECKSSGARLRGQFQGQLPPSAQPSRLEENKDNWLVWELQVRQQVPGQLDETSSFLIPVTLWP